MAAAHIWSAAPGPGSCSSASKEGHGIVSCQKIHKHIKQGGRFVSEENYGRRRDLCVIWEFSKLFNTGVYTFVVFEIM